MRTANIGLFILITCLTSCSSQVLVKEIDPQLAPGSEVDGMPFRVPKRFNAIVFEKHADGYHEVAKLPVTLPDPDKLYTLNFKSQPFSNATMDVAINADNTLQQVSLNSTATDAAALTALGTQINSIATAEQAKKTAKASAETSESNSAIAADKAKQAADLAILQYQNALAKSDISAEDLLKASQNARSAQLDANEKARLAGKPSYFPDVVP